MDDQRMCWDKLSFFFFLILVTGSGSAAQAGLEFWSSYLSASGSTS
jgi:hypothetical protein